MTPRLLSRLGAAALLAVVAATAACSQTPNEQEAQVMFCEDMLAFKGAVTDLAALDPADTTVNQVKSDLGDASDALAELRDTHAQLNAARIDEFQQAVGELRSELQGIDSIEELRAAAPELRATGADVESAFASLSSSAGCQDEDG